MTRLAAGALLAGALLVTPSPARAQGAELGTSLVNASFGLADNALNTLGAPVNGLGFQTPAIYASFFVGPRLAIEPQVSFAWAKYRGNSSHVGSIGLQADYFTRGLQTNSTYLFAVAGVTELPETEGFVGGGIGYRVVLGRLVFRFDGRYTHATEAFGGRGNTLGAGISIGGVFGR